MYLNIIFAGTAGFPVWQRQQQQQQQQLQVRIWIGDFSGRRRSGVRGRGSWIGDFPERRRSGGPWSGDLDAGFVQDFSGTP